MPTEKPRPHVLAARVAGRLLHDFSGPLSALLSGLELLTEGDMGADALELAASSGKALLDLVDFYRAAFGAGEAMGGEALQRLAQTQFEGKRPRLEWALQLEELPPIAAQCILVMAQIAATSLAAGGVARATVRIEKHALVVQVRGEGTRAALQPEAIAGLEGRDLAQGLAGRWAPPRYLSALIADAGGALSATAGVDWFSVTATLPSGEDAA